MSEVGPLADGSAVLPCLGMLDLGLQILKLLAVVGGAAVGGVGSGWLLGVFAKVVVHRPVPPRASRVVKGLGAVALGWAVWLWVYGPGGSGWGLGGGLGGLGSGGESGANMSTTAASRKTPEASKKEAPSVERVAGGETLRVEMLGGTRVHEERFYRLEGETEPRTLRELHQAITERAQQKTRTPVKRLEIVIYANSVNKDHPAVRDLEKWARENDLTPILSFPRRELP